MLNKKAFKKPYKIVSSKYENFSTYCLISGYDTREEAEINCDRDVEKFHRRHKWFWHRYCYGWNGIIKDNEFL